MYTHQSNKIHSLYVITTMLSNVAKNVNFFRQWKENRPLDSCCGLLKCKTFTSTDENECNVFIKDEESELFCHMA